MNDINKRILIIDDDEDILFTLEHRFKMDNYLVITANEPGEGYKTAQTRNPHVILLDVMMPKISGYELIKMFKGNAATRNIPIIVVTAKGKMKDDFLIEGAFDFVVKPYEYEELKKKVDRAILVKSGIE